MSSGELSLLFSSQLYAGIGIFIRLAIAIRLIPFWGTKPLPLWLVAGIAGLLTFIVFPFQMPLAAAPVSAGGIVLRLLTEVCVGLLLGMSIRMCFGVLAVAGGLVNAFAVPASFGDNTELFGKLYFALGTGSFLLLDGHHLIFTALVHSVTVIPAVGTSPVKSAAEVLFLSGGNLFVSSFTVGVMVSVPFFMAAQLAELLLGFWTRLAGGDRSMAMVVLREYGVQVMVVLLLWKSVSFLVQYLQEGIGRLFGPV